MMRRFEHRFRVRAPIEAVSNFHSDTRDLRKLTPMPVQFHEVEPLAEGSRADFTLWAGPVPIRWVAVHSNVEPLNGFEDSQEQGPFEHWHHKHRFVAIDNLNTEIVDEIEAQPGRGLLNELVSRIMWASLPLLFAYRGWKTKIGLENNL